MTRRQLDDYDAHRPGTLFAGNSVAMTVADAYALQRAVARLRERRGERVAGYKVGCISAVMQAQLGLDSPVFGHVFETEIHATGATLDPAAYDGLAIEGEFAVRIARDIPDESWLRAHPREAFASAFAVIELHNYVFRNTPHNAEELIGNNAIHAGLVMPGSEAPLDDPAALPEASVAVWLNGRMQGAARGEVLAEGPFGSVVHLVRHLSSWGEQLRSGQIVLTGSPLPLYRVAAGDQVEVVSDRFGRVSALVKPESPATA